MHYPLHWLANPLASLDAHTALRPPPPPLLLPPAGLLRLRYSCPFCPAKHFRLLTLPLVLLSPTFPCPEAAYFAAPLELSLVLCDDAHIQELNREWRGVDAPTDVLSFELEDDEEVEGGASPEVRHALPACCHACWPRLPSAALHCSCWGCAALQLLGCLPCRLWAAPSYCTRALLPCHPGPSSNHLNQIILATPPLLHPASSSPCSCRSTCWVPWSSLWTPPGGRRGSAATR